MPYGRHPPHAVPLDAPHTARMHAGGTSVAAVRNVGMDNRFTHLLTAGAAMLSFLDGREVPGLWALLRHDDVDAQAQQYAPSASLDM